jgi:hypothetical protein
LGEPALPPVELPADALVLYEEMALDDPDRTGNWRFYVSRDGGFYNARNTQLFVLEPADLARGDPALFWNTDFPPEPQRRLEPAAVAELEQALDGLDLTRFAERLPVGQRVTSAQRWTVARDGDTRSAVVVGKAPPELATLRQTVDRLVAANS